jgi:hypothetical protein
VENFETQPRVGLLGEETDKATKLTPVTQRHLLSRKGLFEIQTTERARHKQSYERSRHAKCFAVVADQRCLAVDYAESVLAKVLLQVG